MNLSIIIINYNVKYFLEQCLISVFKSGKSIDMEVFVVDNASADGSCQMVKQRFPEVRLIENQENVGFSIANNQAIRQANGKYLLLLNPDTVIEEDTLSKCIQFMDTNPNAGSMTVKMIDGKGRYLPESKRALPTPMVSFFKIFGFTRLFPKSKTFARYYLGHLDENKTHHIEILPGAFMFIRKEVLEKVGLLDESFFMYGEDIDLSYRIIKAGFENYYFPETRIIHYKGESTKKGSINYVIIFYKAMLLFAKKHFTQKNIRFFMAMVFLAIYLRAFLSILKRIFKHIYLPIIDIVLITLGFLLIIPFWESFRYKTLDYYPNELLITIVPLYILIWLISLWLSGAYDRSQKVFSATKGVLVGTLIILSFYALLPTELRFSRAIIIISTIWSLLTIQGNRAFIGIINKNIFPSIRKKKRVAIVGSSKEAERTLEILNNAGISYQNCGLISPQITISESSQIASINQLDEFIRVNEINEVIFCSNDISSQEIIKNMLILSGYGIEYKIAPPESISLIGSNSINTLGELYTPDLSAINTPASKRKKRLFDICTSFFLIATFLIWLFIFKKPISLISSSFLVLIGRKTWVGYINSGDETIVGLPRIKECVFQLSSHGQRDLNHLKEINLIYAKSYAIAVDFSILWKRTTGGIKE